MVVSTRCPLIQTVTLGSCGSSEWTSSTLALTRTSSPACTGLAIVHQRCWDRFGLSAFTLFLPHKTIIVSSIRFSRLVAHGTHLSLLRNKFSTRANFVSVCFKPARHINSSPVTGNSCVVLPSVSAFLTSGLFAHESNTHLSSGQLTTAARK